MRTFGKVLTVLFVVTYVVALAEFFVYPAMAKGEKTSGKAPSTMPAGYMNAALQRAQNMGQAKKGKENAKWSENPNDERGQGNMGKPRMRDPYGFDKDSDRIGSERGRPIHEVEVPLLNLAEIVGITFEITDWYIRKLQSLIESSQSLVEQYPQHAYYVSLVNAYQGYLDRYIAHYISTHTYHRLATNGIESIDYTMTFAPPDGFEGTNLLVTTTLTSIKDYSGYTLIYDPVTRRWLGNYESSLHYDAGQVVMEQTQEVTLGSDNTFYYSYDPPTELAGFQGFYGELTVSVTEPVSGASYTITYDRQLYVHRQYF